MTSPRPVGWVEHSEAQHVQPSLVQMLGFGYRLNPTYATNRYASA